MKKMRSVQWVVKLGGSLAESSQLCEWLEALAENNVVIVPGGGPFADTVRATQNLWQYDDPTAHRMAILAMAQYGLMLHALCPRLILIKNIQHLHTAIQTGSSAIWLPDPEELTTPALPERWAVTSDSIAAWLANYLLANALLLVKSVTYPKGTISATTLSDKDVIDRAFPSITEGCTFSSWFCGPSAHLTLRSGLSTPKSHFTQVI